jgi:hypothetical protein
MTEASVFWPGSSVLMGGASVDVWHLDSVIWMALEDRDRQSRLRAAAVHAGFGAVWHLSSDI